MDPIVQRLRQNGYRLTAPRQRIIEVLTAHPQSVDEILLALKSNDERIDKVTVYRTLDCFLDLGIVSKTQFHDKKAQYELIGEDHHHHLVCDQCGSVEDIALDENDLLKKVHGQTEFEVKNHSLEFFGLCVNCQ